MFIGSLCMSVYVHVSFFENSSFFDDSLSFGQIEEALPLSVVVESIIFIPHVASWQESTCCPPFSKCVLAIRISLL